MATNTLPQRTEELNNRFLHTWYKIKDMAVDNILNATVLSAALKMKGCYKPKRGGRLITETLQYAIPETQGAEKGDVLPHGETETETMAAWTFRHSVAHVQRSLFDDAENAGEDMIKSYIKTRIKNARDSLVQFHETSLTRTPHVDSSTLGIETGADASVANRWKYIQSLNDMILPHEVAEYGTGATSATVHKYGGISYTARTADLAAVTGTEYNTWWAPRYKAATANPEINLLTDMKNFYNTCGLNQRYPDLIATTQEWYEIYEEFGLDITQISGNQKLLDLGFTTLKFKGNDMVWTDSLIYDGKQQMLFLDTPSIRYMYDPGLWFDMDGFKDAALQVEKVAHILCRNNLFAVERRHMGRLYEN